MLPGLLGAALALAVWWCGASLAWLAALPLLAARWPRRQQASAYWLGYFGLGFWPLVSAVDDYFNGAWVLGLASWAVLTLLFAGLWSCAWSPAGTPTVQRVGRLLLVVALSLLPPLGAVGFIHPLLAAGPLLPRAGFSGLGVLLVCWAVAAAWPARWRWPVAALLGASLIAHVQAPAADAAPTWVRAVNTHHPAAHTVQELLAQVAALTDTVQHQPEPVPELLVFPESAVQEWRAASADWIERQLLAHPRKQAVLLGTVLQHDSAARRNGALLIAQGQTQFFRQRQPIALGLWAPWRADHYAADWSAPGVITVNGRQLAVRICGEELLLSLALLDFARSQPQLLVALSNHAWSRHAWHDQIQARHTQAVAALFGVPYVRAVNRSPSSSANQASTR